MEIKEELYNQIIEGMKSEDRELLDEELENIYPVDIAEIFDIFEDHEIIKFYSMVDHEYMAKVFEELDDEIQIRLVELLDLKNIIKLFDFMANDDIADILGILRIDDKKKLLNLMKKGEYKDLETLLGYAEDSAGGIMTTEYIALKASLTTEEAINKIKKIGPKTEIIESIFVIDNFKKLIGIVDIRDILIAENEIKLEDIMEQNIISVTPEVDQEEVSLIVSKYDLEIIPVVSKKNKILGIITIDDIIDVIVEENTEDMLKMGGVSHEETVNSSFFMSVKRRLPWLFINLGTAFLAAFTVSLFEDVIMQVVALAAAMPIVAGMGGNSGTQTLSIVIRGIALGEVDIKEDLKYILKEIGLGIFNGAVLGLVTGAIIFYKYGNIYLSLIIFAAMIGNLVIAGMFGFSLPLILKKLGIDPALASAIFLTTATDVFGFFIFLGLAKIFLALLI